MLAWFRQFLRSVAVRPDGTDKRGAEGERIAAAYLEKRMGYAIVVRNWRNPLDLREEIDLVCRDHDVLVFVEVKTRPAEALVPGYYAVNRRKKKVLRSAIHTYLTQLRLRPRTFRFDIAEVVTSAKLPPQVLHYQNVPLFPRGYHVLGQE